MSGTALSLFFSPEYLASANQSDTMQKAGWIAEPLTAAQFHLVHDPAYVEAVRLGESRWLAESSDLAYAGPHRGCEGFSFDENGRKSDVALHAELLGDDDAFTYDLDEFAEMSAAEQDEFLKNR